MPARFGSRTEIRKRGARLVFTTSVRIIAPRAAANQRGNVTGVSDLVRVHRGVGSVPLVSRSLTKQTCGNTVRTIIANAAISPQRHLIRSVSIFAARRTNDRKLESTY